MFSGLICLHFTRRVPEASSTRKKIRLADFTTESKVTQSRNPSYHCIVVLYFKVNKIVRSRCRQFVTLGKISSPAMVISTCGVPTKLFAKSLITLQILRGRLARESSNSLPLLSMEKLFPKGLCVFASIHNSCFLTFRRESAKTVDSYCERVVNEGLQYMG